MGITVPANDRILHGYSLGSGVAVDLAAQRGAKLLVIEAGFDRLCKHFVQSHKGLPACQIMRKDRFDSIDKIANVTMPVLFLHGEKDTALPIRWAKNLFDAANEPKQFVTYPEGTHVNLHQHGFIEDVMRIESSWP